MTVTLTSEGVTPTWKHCKRCGKAFKYRRKSALYCSDKCRVYASRGNPG